MDNELRKLFSCRQLHLTNTVLQSKKIKFKLKKEKKETVVFVGLISNCQCIQDTFRISATLIREPSITDDKISPCDGPFMCQLD